MRGRGNLRGWQMERAKRPTRSREHEGGVDVRKDGSGAG